MIQTVPAHGDAEVGGPYVHIGRAGQGSLTVSNGGQFIVEGDDSGISVGQRYGSQGALTLASGGLVRMDAGDVFGYLEIAGGEFSRGAATIDAGNGRETSRGNG